MILHKVRDWGWETGIHPLVNLGFMGKPGEVILSSTPSCVCVFHANVDLQETVKVL